MVEPGDYVTDEKYAFTETIDAWLNYYNQTPTNKTRYIVTILSTEYNGQRKFVTLPIPNKKETLMMFKKAQELFKHPSIMKASFSMTQVLEMKLYEASNPN